MRVNFACTQTKRNLENFAKRQSLNQLERWNNVLSCPNSRITPEFLGYLVLHNFKRECLEQILLACEHGVNTSRLIMISEPDFSDQVIEQLRLACEHGICDDEIRIMVQHAYKNPSSPAYLKELREGFERKRQVEKLITKCSKMLNLQS